MFSCCKTEKLNIGCKKERLEKKCIVTTSFTFREVSTIRNGFTPRSKDVLFPNNQRQSRCDSRLRKCKNNAAKLQLTSNSFKLMHSKTRVYVFIWKLRGAMELLYLVCCKQMLSRYCLEMQTENPSQFWTATPSCVCVTLCSSRLLMVSLAGCFLP